MESDEGEDAEEDAAEEVDGFGAGEADGAAAHGADDGLIVVSMFSHTATAPASPHHVATNSHLSEVHSA